MSPGLRNKKQTGNRNKKAFLTNLIAPCGMDCLLCLAYTRDRNVCPGCRLDDPSKNKSCVRCRIKNCERLTQDGRRYCIGCDGFPCARLKQLDKRYRTKYGMSMTENLEAIKESGIRKFIQKEKKRWTCPECGGTICVHRPQCPSCGRKWR